VEEATGKGWKMSIWFKNYTVEDLNKMCKNNMLEHIGIEFTEIGSDYLKAKMPVDNRTKQPAGLLHGGASVTLAETLGSVGAYLCVDPQKYTSVGIEINANHLRSVTEGFVYGKAKPVHIGRKSQVWEIKIHNDRNKLICISRITLAVVDKPL
jgi:1,4-dihydroxy-2-naphthoyl-CoA hydrolase